MKLWLKQTLVTLAVILLSVSVCLYHFVAQETDQLIQQAIQSGARDSLLRRCALFGDAEQLGQRDPPCCEQQSDERRYSRGIEKRGRKPRAADVRSASST